MTTEKLSSKNFVRGVLSIIVGLFLCSVVYACWGCFGNNPYIELIDKPCDFGRDLWRAISLCIKGIGIGLGVMLGVYGLVCIGFSFDTNGTEFKKEVKRLTKEGK